MFCRSLFVLLYFFLAIVLSVLLRITDSDYLFGIFELFLIYHYLECKLTVSDKKFPEISNFPYISYKTFFKEYPQVNSRSIMIMLICISYKTAISFKGIGPLGLNRMVVRFITTYAISAYHHRRCYVESTQAICTRYNIMW